MLLIIGWGGSFALSVFNKLYTKKISWIVKEKRNNHLFFLLINSLTACVFFFISNRFHIQFTVKTLICAAIYAVIILLSFPISFAIFRVADITTASVLGNVGGLVTNSLMGAVVFKEQITLLSIIRILLMVGTILLITINERRFIRTRRKKSALKPLLGLTLASIAIGCISTLLQKYHANAPDVSDTKSYFFITNLMVIMMVFPLFIWRIFHSGGQTLEHLKAFPYRYLPLFMGNTLISNLASVVSMFLIARMPVSVYTPVGAAVGILSSITASLVWKEHLTIYSVLATVFSLIAVIV